MKWKFWSGQSPDSNFIEKLWNKQNAQKHFSVAKLKQSSIKELNFSTVMWKTGSGTHDLKPWFYIYLGYLSCFASWSETFKSMKYPKTRNQEGDKYFFIHHSFCANEWVRSQNPWNGNKQRNLLNPWMTVWYMLILKCYFRLLDFYFDLKKKHENWNTTFALLTIHVRCSCSGQRASQHRIEQKRQVHSSLAGAVCSVNDTLAADRCGSLSARVIIGICESMSLMLEDWSKGSKGAEVLPKAVNLYSILTEEKLAPSSLKTFDMTQRERRHTGTPIHETEPWLVISSTGAFPAMISQNICHEKCLLGNNGNCTL